MRILLITDDNKDIHHLTHVLQMSNPDSHNSHIDIQTPEDIHPFLKNKLHYERIIIILHKEPLENSVSLCSQILEKAKFTIPVLGIGNGMLGIAVYYGAISTPKEEGGFLAENRVYHTGKGIFTGVQQGIEQQAYYQNTISAEMLPDCLEVSAYAMSSIPPTYTTDIRDIPVSSKRMESCNPHMLQRKALPRQTTVMGFRHTTYPVEGIGVDSRIFSTENGKQMLHNFLSQYKP